MPAQKLSLTYSTLKSGQDSLEPAASLQDYPMHWTISSLITSDQALPSSSLHTIAPFSHELPFPPPTRYTCCPMGAAAP